MEIICNPSGIVDINRPGQGIMDITRAGFENSLLHTGIACSAYELENFGLVQETTGSKNKIMVSEVPSELHNRMQPLLDRYTEGRLHISIMYAPSLYRDTKRDDLEELLSEVVRESIKFCGKTGCRYLIVKPLFSWAGHENVWEANKRFYADLIDTARDNNVIILLENQYCILNGHIVRGICSDAHEAASWIDWLNNMAGEERFGFCMDTGVCNLCAQNMREFAVTLGNRIKAVCLRECDGYTVTAMLPFTCVNSGQSATNWLSLIRGLREIGFDGQLIMDFGSTAASFSPLLRPQLMQLAKAVADYFKWQIELESLMKKHKSIVLFGAGNMCRNYMKCYGDKYPPLFTCDNNHDLWGTYFCGLEVKSPECLKDLPEDCAIFICNIYYREIEQQLRDMGIKNPIEFFNDEYMPSFYFDRIEREN